MAQLYLKQILKNGIYRALLWPYTQNAKYSYDYFQFDAFKDDVLSYIGLMRRKAIYEYRFSALQREPDLYSSVYGAMTLGLLGEIHNLSSKDKNQWAEFLLSHQGKDGLFRDTKLNSPLSETCHYWGWHHLVPHVLIALEYLNVKPFYDFKKALSLFKDQSMGHWLATRSWQESYLAVSNEIMNVAIMLQYSRDWFDNDYSRKLVYELKNWLLRNRRDAKTSLWGHETDRSLIDISKGVKTAYHLLPIFYFDEDENTLDQDAILRFALKTQNSKFGFGPDIVTDACEDIDSIYLLTTLDTQDKVLAYTIQKAVCNYLNWVFVNMNQDGGFVFKRIRPFQYADQPRLSSTPNQSNMFGTWFRTLSIAFACTRIGLPHSFKFSNVPGYQFYKV